MIVTSSSGGPAESILHEPSPRYRSRLSEAQLLRWLRIAFWIGALFLGSVQTWDTRHVIFSDGISYIEIAKAYLAGNWSAAINPYWSPLYSWLLAAAYFVLRPSPYWEVATLHVVNLVGFLISCLAFEFFLSELLRYRRVYWRGEMYLSKPVMYLAGYCTILFAGISTATIWYCSPDMFSMALLLLLSGLLLRIGSLGGNSLTFLLFGVVCGLSFLARTAFAPIFVVCLATTALLLYRRQRPVVKPVLIISAVMLLMCAPFVIAISQKVGRFTIGESGALNYGWEVAGAARYAHWQGEPGDIGRPKHPTTQISQSPKAYTFTGPVPGTYSPWFNPAYWYDGIKPKFKVSMQVKVLLVNISVAANLFFRSGAFLSLVVLLFWTGYRGWLRNMAGLWPILLPAVTIFALYCLVYVEKRYIAGNLVILWMAALAAAPLRTAGARLWGPRVVVAICVLFTIVYVLRRQSYPIRVALVDLVTRHEKYANVQYLIAQHLLRAGLRAGDKIAYIGPAVDAEWAHLAGVKIVAEIPLVYDRYYRPMNNTLRLRADDIRGFWETTAARRHAIIDGFKRAGARMVVADGFYEQQYVTQWPKALPDGAPGVDKIDLNYWTDLNLRYAWLDPSAGSNQLSSFVQ